jgi:hypothetical protein
MPAARIEINEAFTDAEREKATKPLLYFSTRKPLSRDKSNIGTET